VKWLVRSGYAAAQNGQGWVRPDTSRPALGRHLGQGAPRGTAQRYQGSLSQGWV